jgi:DNA-binding GntR family transcriptional regulator
MRCSAGYRRAMTIDRHGMDPLYQQVAAVLRARIESGDLPPGRALPSETQLMGEFGVSRITARHAVRLLADEGLVKVVQGRGVFVLPR